MSQHFSSELIFQKGKYLYISVIESMNSIWKSYLKINLILFFICHLTKSSSAQNYYQIPGAQIQPQFVFPLFIEAGNGNRDTLYLGYDSLSHDIISHVDSDTLFGIKKVFVDTNGFYALWHTYLFNCGLPNHACDSVYKVNVTPLSSCHTDCFPSQYDFLLIHGRFPIKLSWDVTTLRNDSVPFPDQSPSPKAQGYLIWDIPNCWATENGSLWTYGPYEIITDTVVASYGTKRDSITIFHPLGNILFDRIQLNLFIEPWNGINTLVKEMSNKTKINLFPNPTTEFTEIKTDLNEFELKLFDLLGNELNHQIVKGGGMNLNLSNYSKGIYIVKLFFQNKTESRLVLKM